MKPSEIKTIRAKKAHLLLPHFQGITWMGTLYCNRTEDIEKINKSDKIDSDFKSHETIHVRQAQSMNDSWLRFYLNYVWNYIKNLPLIFVDPYAPYRLIPTEIEAYLNQRDWEYAEKQEPVFQWKALEKLTLKQKREIAREYEKARPRRTFAYVLNEYFKEHPIT